MVGETTAADGGEDAERNADAGTQNDRYRRQLDRRRQYAGDVLHDGTAGQERRSEIAVEKPCHEDPELLEKRLIQPQLLLNLQIGRAVGIRADDGGDRIDRHHPADDKCEDEQQNERRYDADERAAHPRISFPVQAPLRRLNCIACAMSHSMKT